MKILQKPVAPIFALFADDIAITIFVIWGLPALGIHLPIGAVVGIMSGVVTRSVMTYRLGRRVLLKKPKTGYDDMSGNIGRVLEPINPKGLVKINNEVWIARYSGGGSTNSQRIGCEVVVVGRKGLTLFVSNLESGYNGQK
jgi:membrane protein implicated in regulation of membrane protease activity